MDENKFTMLGHQIMDLWLSRFPRTKQTTDDQGIKLGILYASVGFNHRPRNLFPDMPARPFLFPIAHNVMSYAPESVRDYREKRLMHLQGGRKHPDTTEAMWPKARRPLHALEP